MCFSALASFAAGTVLTGIGAVTISATRDSRALPFAAIPLLFGAQQITEGLLWLVMDGGAPILKSCFTYGFSMFSHVLWPVYAPLSVLLVEGVSWRRRAIAATLAGGVALSFLLLYALIRFPMTAELDNGHIFYRSPHFDFLFNSGLFLASTALYLAATCFSMLLSSNRIINLFGAATLAAFGVTYIFYETALISVWCFFAALLSAIVWVWTRRSNTGSQPPEKPELPFMITQPARTS